MDQPVSPLSEKKPDTGQAAAKELTFDVTGMTCASCVARVEKALEAVPEVTDARVNFALGRADVVFAGAVADQDEITAAIRRAGYDAHLRKGNAVDDGATEPLGADDEMRVAGFRLVIAALFTLPLLVPMIGMVFGQDWHMAGWIEWALATPVLFWGGAVFFRGAWRGLKHGSATMDTLVVLGTSAAYGYSVYLTLKSGHAVFGGLYFEAAAVIVTFILAGRWLEARARFSTTAALRSLMALRPKLARLRRGDEEVMVPLNEVVPGDVAIIRPGESVSVDGDVIDGHSEIDEAMISGESLPVPKKVGDPVTAGTINTSGLLVVKATAVGADTTLAKIIQMVERTQSGKAPVQRLVDRVTSIFVPFVMGVALVTFLAWLLSGGGLESALVSAVSVLVIACPCALGLATPTAIVTGSGAGARAGILVRDIETLEKVHRADVVAFDKTGTLTEGQPKVVSIQLLQEGLSENGLLALAAGVQANSEHPLARSVGREAEARKISVSASAEFTNVPGAGTLATVSGQHVAVGNAALMGQEKIDPKEYEAALAMAHEAGHTASVIAIDGQAAGVISFADTVREGTPETISALEATGLKTLMLSGDNASAAQAIGVAAGIDNILAPVSPDQKLEEITRLRRSKRVVIMVGDGINDAPALAAADAGIAMGGGTDVAMETAGITLMRPDIRLVAGAIDLSKATWRKLKQNLFWAFIFNTIGIPVAAFGLLTPEIAGAAMAASSVTVVLNSLLLKRWRPRLIPTRLAPTQSLTGGAA